MPKKRILVAPLNWGLGHATRCIPVIYALLEENFEPVLASDGAALELLRKEFPYLEWHQLPAYNIRYSKNPAFFGLKLLQQTPHILQCIKEEKEITHQLVKSQNLAGIISDNRWGVRSGNVPSAFITHQIKVFSGITTSLSTYMQQRYIKKFDKCWVPDNAKKPNLSGSMGHAKEVSFPVKYLGVLSRFEKEVLDQLYDITVLLSGPEPQRGMLEAIMEKELKKLDLRVLIIRGVVEERSTREVRGNITRVNFLTTKELQKALNSSALVISRSGYTSLMDLAKLEKKVFFIPTPGQPEQLYLAKRMKSEGVADFCKQKDFDIKKLDGMQYFKNLGSFKFTRGLGGIFTLFQGE
ncbi:glycosyltransferase [Antarcticibacterium arcticum]|uniref:Glycosyltransferase n=1 Tax=Antarcticibacterium arcticum TaxID=2585771 RepID=A0A5B8YN96_9FLAO|nr:glycosyltransferase [Antarcticibacterium arcticum]QED38758.1 glycosyltransferase [Antarcticibacterium arcticum]